MTIAFHTIRRLGGKRSATGAAGGAVLLAVIAAGLYGLRAHASAPAVSLPATRLGYFHAGDWTVRNIDGSISHAQFGGQGDTPVPADYQDSGSAQLAVYNAGTWTIQGGGSPTFGGSPGDIPVPANYQGGSKVQLAVYNGGTWRIQGVGSFSFGGNNGDIPVPADYQGSGKAQLAVFNAGTWTIQGMDHSVTFEYQPGDIPVPGAYSGLGHAQIAVFRPSTGVWIIRGDDSSAIAQIPFGSEEDTPAPAAYPFGLGQ